MVVYENQGNGLVKAYSDAGFMIRGGFPEADYDVAYDPEGESRTYAETDIPVRAEEA